MIHFLTPYDVNKDLGKAYNDAIRRIRIESGDDCFCLMDIDVMFLTPDGPAIIEKYIEELALDNVGMLTCYTNRVGSKEQILGARPDDNSDIKHHIRLAEFRKGDNGLTELNGDISGMLMVIPYLVWESHPFKEGIGCLGVDTEYCRRLRADGYSIQRMNALYVWHTYRLLNGVGNKKHLL